MYASAKLFHNCCLSACRGAGTHLAAQNFKALRLMTSRPPMAVLLVAMVSMLVMEPRSAMATPGFLGRDGYPARDGGSNETHRHRASNSTGNGGVHNGGSKHVGGNMHVGRINKDRLYNGGHKRSNITIHGTVPAFGNTSGHKGGKSGRVISIGRKGDRWYRRTDSSNGRHIHVGGNIHVGRNGINGSHEGRNTHPRIIIHRGNHGAGRGGRTYIGVRNGGRYGKNYRAGNRKGNGGHVSAGRNGGSSRGVSHGGLNKTRGNGGRKTHIRGKGGSDGGKAPGPSTSGDKGGSDGGNPGDSAADCKKKGGVCGDPKVVGGDGVVFYFHGRKDHDFCLVSDSDLHINAHFIGTRPPGRTRDNTWVQALGVVSGPHTLTIAAKRNVSQWHDQVDHLEFSYNGAAVSLTTVSWTSPDAAMTLTRIGAANSVDLAIKGKMEVSLTVVPISETANLAHKYAIPEDVDCFAHFDMQFRFYNLSASVNGVLGQTYQPGFRNPVDGTAAMPIMGGAEKFESSSLLATDCKASQYTASAVPVGSATATFHTVCGSSGLPVGVPGGVTCH